MKIVIAGGTGFIGKELNSHFTNNGEEVIILGRSCDNSNPKEGKWDGKSLGDWVDKLKGTDVLINLTGKSVDCRYTEENKRLIMDSRVNSILVLEKAFLKLNEQPKVWLNASTATIYKNELEKPNDEFSTKIGQGFSVEVAKKWETTLREINLPNTRKIRLRITIVLGKKEGAYPVFKKMAKFGVGGRQGSGKQMFSWIHIIDLVNIVDFCIHNESISGAINCSAPEQVSNQVFMKELRKSLKVFFGIPTPTLLLKIGAKIIGTEPELILKSRWVKSKKLEDLNFSFKFDTIVKALEDLKNK